MVEGYSNNNMNKPVSPTKEHPVSDDVDLYVPEDDQPPRSSLAQHESSEHVDTTGSRETKDLKRPLDLTPSIGKFYCNIFHLQEPLLLLNLLFEEWKYMANLTEFDLQYPPVVATIF